jgi:hypothetical protein
MAVYHAKGESNGCSGINGIPPVFERIQTSLRGERLDGGHESFRCPGGGN